MSDRLVLRGGTVVDGTGTSSFVADVVIEGDSIAYIGDAHEAAGRIVDVEGAVVCPGFIDLHSHADHSILAFPEADSALRQGITTVAIGNCGGGVAPISPDFDIRPVAFASKPEWDVPATWSSFGEYMEQLSGLGINVAALVPQGALRNSVMGVVPRPATESELESMKSALSETLENGAVGLSSGLQYRPGGWTPESEIRSLVEIVGAHSGIYASHMRDRSHAYVAAIEEAMRATTDTEAHLQLSHVVARPNAPSDEIERALALLDAVPGRFGVDTFPEPWGPGLLVDLLPSELMEGETTEILARLSDPQSRSTIEAYIDDEMSFLARVAGYDEIYLSWVPGRPDLNGTSLGDVGGVGSFCCDLLIEADAQMREVGIRHIYADEDQIDRVLQLPYCSVASDGIVTTGEDDDCQLLWSASTYGYTARLLELYVNQRRLLTLEDAIRKMTSLPAAALGLSNRGTINVGSRADLVVFDPELIHDRSTPVTMARHPEGIRTVVVNGLIAFDGGASTNPMAGQLVGSF